MKDRTTLILAHRLSSVIKCERILVLDKGRVVESGSHAELINKTSIYTALMTEQVHEAELKELVMVKKNQYL
jgi:ATP-binding cassette subfamily C protein CydCD